MSPSAYNEHIMSEINEFHDFVVYPSGNKVQFHKSRFQRSNALRSIGPLFKPFYSYLNVVYHRLVSIRRQNWKNRAIISQFWRERMRVMTDNLTKMVSHLISHSC